MLSFITCHGHKSPTKICSTKIKLYNIPEMHANCGFWWKVRHHSLKDYGMGLMFFLGYDQGCSAFVVLTFAWCYWFTRAGNGQMQSQQGQLCNLRKTNCCPRSCKPHTKALDMNSEQIYQINSLVIQDKEKSVQVGASQ